MDGKRLGIGLIVVGFVVAVVMGGWLAGQAAQAGTVAGDLLVPAVLAFVPVALLVGGGIYLFQRQPEMPVAESDVQLQRRLVDMVNEKGQTSIDELAAALQTSPQRVRDLLEQLIALEVFAGDVDWQAGMVYAQVRKR